MENQNLKSNEKQSTTVVKPKNKHRVLKFLWKYKFSFLLLLGFIIYLAWSQFQLFSIKKEKIELEKHYTELLDDLENKNYQQLAQVFSWVIRSDMMRNNLDQVEQYLLKITENSQIEKAYIVNHNNREIVLSNNNNEVGLEMNDANFQNLKESQFFLLNDLQKRFITPITDFNKQIGALVIEIKSE